MTSTPHFQRTLYRTAFDLVASRQQDAYEMFESVLAELDTDCRGDGVLGVLGVTNLTVRYASTCAQRAPADIISALRINGCTPTSPALPDVFTMLYLTGEDLTGACDLARNVGGEQYAVAAMVALADVSVAMIERVTLFAGLPSVTVIAALREQCEHQMQAGTWST